MKNGIYSSASAADSMTWSFSPASLTPSYQNPMPGMSESAKENRKGITSGFNGDKADERTGYEMARRSLIKKVLRFANALCQYADKSGNKRLSKDINCSEDYLERLRGTDLAIKGRTILAYTRKYLKELHFYYIADEDILEFESEMKNYTKILEGTGVIH